jgi:hypothetical protein
LLPSPSRAVPLVCDGLAPCLRDQPSIPRGCLPSATSLYFIPPARGRKRLQFLHRGLPSSDEEGVGGGGSSICEQGHLFRNVRDGHAVILSEAQRSEEPRSGLFRRPTSGHEAPRLFLRFQRNSHRVFERRRSAPPAQCLPGAHETTPGFKAQRVALQLRPGLGGGSSGGVKG